MGFSPASFLYFSRAQPNIPPSSPILAVLLLSLQYEPNKNSFVGLSVGRHSQQGLDAAASYVGHTQSSLPISQRKLPPPNRPAPPYLPPETAAFRSSM
jgi:hypothetical protein